MERCCQAELLALSASNGAPLTQIPDQTAAGSAAIIGTYCNDPYSSNWHLFSSLPLNFRVLSGAAAVSVYIPSSEGVCVVCRLIFRWLVPIPTTLQEDS